MFYCNLKSVRDIEISFSDSELGRLRIVKFAILPLIVVLLLKYRGCWVGQLKLCEIWEKMFCETGWWGWFCRIIFVEMQKPFLVCHRLRNSLHWFSENSNELICLCQCFTIMYAFFYLLQLQVISLCSKVFQVFFLIIN